MMTIGPEVAFFLASEDVPEGAFEVEIHLRFLGSKILKGVLSGKPYPIFWIDTQYDEKLLQAYDDLLSEQPRLGREKVKVFCRAFFAENSSQIYKPFIDGSKDPEFNEIPENYAENLHYLATTLRDITEKIRIETASLKGESPDDSEKAQKIGPSEAESFAKEVASTSNQTSDTRPKRQKKRRRKVRPKR